jgi:hypothetical protein
MREVIQNAVDGLAALLAKYDEVSAAIESLGAVKAQLVSAQAAHNEALAQLAEGQRVLAVAQLDHKRSMEAMEGSLRVAQAKVFGLIEEAQAKQTEIDGMRQYHDELLASIQSLKKRLESLRLEPVR